MNEEKKEIIRRFLIEFKKIVTTGRGLDVVPRRQNIEALAELGLTKRNRRDEIMTLSVSDYCEGPEADRDKPGNIWIFGKRINEREVYIKLKIAHVGKERIAKCLSFHIATFPLCFQCRPKKKEK